MTVREPPRLSPDLWKWTLASGVLAVILGICVLVWPGISILVAATLFGLYLLITGIAQVIFAFALDVSAGSRHERFHRAPRAHQRPDLGRPVTRRP